MGASNEELLIELASLVKFLKDETKGTPDAITQKKISLTIGLAEDTLGKIIKGKNEASNETLQSHIDNIKAHYRDYFNKRKYTDSKLDIELKIIHANLALIKSKIAILWERFEPNSNAAENILSIENEVEKVVNSDKKKNNPLKKS